MALMITYLIRTKTFSHIVVAFHFILFIFFFCDKCNQSQCDYMLYMQQEYVLKIDFTQIFTPLRFKMPFLDRGGNPANRFTKLMSQNIGPEFINYTTNCSGNMIIRTQFLGAYVLKCQRTKFNQTTGIPHKLINHQIVDCISLNTPENFRSV